MKHNRKPLDLRVGDKVKIIDTGIFCGTTHSLNKIITIKTTSGFDFTSHEGPYGYIHDPESNSFWKYLELLNNRINYEVYV